MRLAAALLLTASVARAVTGPMEVRRAAPERVEAIQAVLASPAGAEMTAAVPGLGAIAALDPSDSRAQALLGLLSAQLPETFASAVTAAAASPDGSAALSAASEQLRSAYARSAALAPQVLDGKIRRLTRLHAEGGLSREDLDRAFDGLASFGVYGDAAVQRLASLARARTAPPVERTQAALSATTPLERPAARKAVRAPEAQSAERDVLTIPAGTPVRLRLDFAVDDLALREESIDFSGAQRATVDGVPFLMRAAVGEVAHVQRRGLFGRPGEIVVRPVSARAVDGQTVRLEGGEIQALAYPGRNLLHAAGSASISAFGAWLLHPKPSMVLPAFGLALLLLAMPGWGARLRHGEVSHARTAEEIKVRVGGRRPTV